MVAKRLILWDIDGTLLRTGSAGRRALEVAAAKVGNLVDIPAVEMAGKTDPQIIREILALAAMADGDIDLLLPDAIRAAEAALAADEDSIRSEGNLLPGVAAVLERLADTPGVRQSAVTGNLAANAAVKLASFRMERFVDLEVGAFGTDHHDRNELVPIALARVEKLRGETYAPDEVWVVGDTERDLACARVGGVRCLMVGTGPVGAELAGQLGADAFVDDLSDTEQVVGILCG